MDFYWLVGGMDCKMLMMDALPVQQTTTKSDHLFLNLAHSDVDGAIPGRLGPGQCPTWIPAVPDQRESLQAQTPGLSGGPAETGPTCTEATNKSKDPKLRL